MDMQQKSNDFGLEMTEVLTKAEVMFSLSKILQDHYPRLGNWSEKEIFTIDFRRGDGTFIARCIQQESGDASHFPQYSWVKEENLEKIQMQQTSNNTCPPAVVEVLIKAAIMFDLAKLLQNSGISTTEPENFMLEVGYGNTMLGIIPVRCPCSPTRRSCCG